MRAEFHKDFDRQLARLPRKLQGKALEAVSQFLDEPFKPSLCNHELKGNWEAHRSISAGGDLRLHFQITDTGTVAYFVAVGTHSQLYK